MAITRGADFCSYGTATKFWIPDSNDALGPFILSASRDGQCLCNELPHSTEKACDVAENEAASVSLSSTILFLANRERFLGDNLSQLAYLYLRCKRPSKVGSGYDTAQQRAVVGRHPIAWRNIIPDGPKRFRTFGLYCKWATSQRTANLEWYSAATYCY